MADKVPLKCAKCGSESFSLPTNPSPDSIVTCVGCGAAGKYGEIQKQALKQSKRAVEDALKKAFKKWK